MVEKLSPSDSCRVPNLLKTLMYANAQDCTLLPFFVRFQPSQGEAKTYHIASISTKSQILTEPGFFIISLDFIRPVIADVVTDPIIEKVEGSAPSIPLFRLNESRLNGDHIINMYDVDEVFEPSAMTIHRRLMGEIIEIKRQSDIEESDRLGRLFEEITKSLS